MGTSYGETQTMQYDPPFLVEPAVVYNAFSNTLVFRVKANSGTSLAERGFVWNTNGQVPVLGQDDQVFLSPDAPAFSYTLNSPQKGTRYTMRAFAVNETGLAYSDTTSYYLDIDLPQVVTLKTGETVTTGYYSASVKGTVTDPGSEPIVAYGHCWSLAESPTVEDSHTDFGQIENPVDFVSDIKGLIMNTTYYVRAYIQTGLDIYYGEQVTFRTLQDESVVVSDGMKMYITTDNTPKAYEWTGQVPDLTVSNGVTYNTGNKPSGTTAAISFNGSSGYLLSRYYNPLSGAAKGTFNFWMRFRNKMNKSLVYPFFGSISEGGFFVEIRHDGTNWVLTLCLGPGKETYVIPLPSYAGMDITDFLGVSWHMMSIVSNGTAMTVYLDGMNLYTEPMEMSFGVQDDFVIGANALNGTTLNTFLPADMACLRFYDRVLIDSEIVQIFNAGQ